MTTLNGQVIGDAQRAVKVLLDQLLSRTGTTFDQWVALNLIASQGGTASEEVIEARMTDGLQIDRAAVGRVLAELAATGLIDGVSLTEAGRERHAGISAGINEITARLYGDVPAEELEIAGRVLVTITTRARAELAA
jgi:DNA-binding MarR family transcriptional regulator